MKVMIKLCLLFLAMNMCFGMRVKTTVTQSNIVGDGSEDSVAIIQNNLNFQDIYDSLYAQFGGVEGDDTCLHNLNTCSGYTRNQPADLDEARHCLRDFLEEENCGNVARYFERNFPDYYNHL